MSKLITIEITDEPVNPARSWTDKTTGMVKPIPASQTAYVFNGGKMPFTSFSVDVDDRRGPLRPGTYLLGGGSMRLYKGELQFNKYGAELVSIEEALAQLRPSQVKAA
jgi:hypothetical protein